MKLRPEQLPEHLRQTLLPVYLVTGEEPLLVQECGDQIRRAARSAGCAERAVHDAGMEACGIPLNRLAFRCDA